MFGFLVEQARRFRRITSSGKYSPAVDGVRFLAIALVLFQHLHERIYRHVGDHYDVARYEYLSGLGSLGVSIFFSLSGYILYRQLSSAYLERGRADLQSYYIRRVTRLEPPYIVATTLLCLVAVLGVHSGGTHFVPDGMPIAQSYFATLTYTHQLIFGAAPYVNPLGWTLEVEVQFYLIAPLIAFLMTRCRDARGRMLMGLAAMLLLIYVIIPNTSTRVYIHDPTVYKLPFFLVGIILCDLRHSVTLHQVSRAGILDALGAGALFLLLAQWTVPAHAMLMTCALIFLVILGILDGRWVHAVFSHPIIATIGGMCYTIYLTHLPITEMVCSKTCRLFFAPSYMIDLALQAVIVMPIVIGLGFVFYALIERPCMRKTWPQDLWIWLTSRSSPPVVPSPVDE